MTRSKKKNRAKITNYFRKFCFNIKKVTRRISLRSTLHQVIKNFLLCIIFCVTACFLYLFVRTRSPLSDIFTINRISILKDRPTNITRDIVVDMANFAARGGMLTLTRSLIVDIAKKRQNWRLLILVPKNRSEIYNFPKYPNIKLIETGCFPITFFF